MPEPLKTIVERMVTAGEAEEDIALVIQHYKQQPSQPAQPEGSAIGRFAGAAWEKLNPVAAVKGVAQAVRHPVDTYNAAVDASAQQFSKAGEAYQQGRYSEAIGHGVAGALPVIGPAAADTGEQIGRGDVAGGLGSATGLLAPFGAGAAVKAVRGALPARAASVAPAVNPAVEFARARGIPLDAATVSDNLAVKGTQALVDRGTLGGAAVATGAKAKQAAAMERVGGELLDTAHPGSMTPEMAGTSLRDALGAKVATHSQSANAAYDAVRALESPATTVQLGPVKAALQPVYEQMKRQMPLTQQQANPGLKALQNIMEGPDSGPLSLIDRDLGAMKTIAREQGGLAKLAVARLDKAVTSAATAGGPDVLNALKAGRDATKAKYAASDVLDKLHAEPVKTIDALIAPRDTAIQRLRAVAEQAPDQVPEIARASLEKVLESPQKSSTWNKLGPETKATLFPDAAHLKALDSFFDLTDRMSKTNVNPSGSGYMAALAAQGGLMFWNPVTQIPIQIGAAGVAKLLRSKTAIAALTTGLRMPKMAGASTQTAALTRLANAAAQVGVNLQPETP